MGVVLSSTWNSFAHRRREKERKTRMSRAEPASDKGSLENVSYISQESCTGMFRTTRTRVIERVNVHTTCHSRRDMAGARRQEAEDQRSIGSTWPHSWQHAHSWRVQCSRGKRYEHVKQVMWARVPVNASEHVDRPRVADAWEWRRRERVKRCAHSLERTFADCSSARALECACKCKKWKWKWVSKRPCGATRRTPNGYVRRTRTRTSRKDLSHD